MIGKLMRNRDYKPYTTRSRDDRTAAGSRIARPYVAYCDRCGDPLYVASGFCPECGADLTLDLALDIRLCENRERKGRVLAIATLVVGLTLAYLEPQALSLDSDLEQEMTDGIGVLTFLLSVFLYSRHRSSSKP